MTSDSFSGICTTSEGAVVDDGGGGSGESSPSGDVVGISQVAHSLLADSSWDTESPVFESPSDGRSESMIAESVFPDSVSTSRCDSETHGQDCYPS